MRRARVMKTVTKWVTILGAATAASFATGGIIERSWVAMLCAIVATAVALIASLMNWHYDDVVTRGGYR